MSWVIIIVVVVLFASLIYLVIDMIKNDKDKFEKQLNNDFGADALSGNDNSKSMN